MVRLTFTVLALAVSALASTADPARAERKVVGRSLPTVTPSGVELHRNARATLAPEYNRLKLASIELSQKAEMELDKLDDDTKKKVKDENKAIGNEWAKAAGNSTRLANTPNMSGAVTKGADSSTLMSVTLAAAVVALGSVVF